MPSSIVVTGQRWNLPCATASTTSSRSIRFATLDAGRTTPCSPVSPPLAALHTSKKPSTLCVTPPTGWIWPRWLTEPVTASDCLMGSSARLDIRTYSSVEEALSPSTPSYDCSNVMLADRLSGLSWA